MRMDRGVGKLSFRILVISLNVVDKPVDKENISNFKNRYI